MSREITQLKFFHCLRDWETASKEFLLMGEQFALSDNIWVSLFIMYFCVSIRMFFQEIESYCDFRCSALRRQFITALTDKQEEKKD